MRLISLVLFISTTVAGSHVFAVNYLNEYLKSLSEKKTESSRKIMSEWNPKSFQEESYKKYFQALESKKAEDFWKLYQDLSKNKKMLKLRHESIKNIIEIDLTSEKSVVKEFKNFNKVAKQLLDRMRGLPDGQEYELLYLKWILKYNNSKELCKTERLSRVSQPSLYLIEVLHGFESCPITYDDFIYRMRLLVFSGEEKRALIELEDYSEIRKLSDWEKAYLKAVYYSNIGDPKRAYDTAIAYEDEIKKNEDYHLNLFYISQRAGELLKAERIISDILDETNAWSKKKGLLFQKAFLFYQTKRYVEASKIFNQLIKEHPSYRTKFKSKEFDELTWLRAWCHYLAKEFKEARQYLLENKKWSSDKARNFYWLAQTEWALDNRMTALAMFRELALPVISGKFFSYYNYLAWLRFENSKNFIDDETLNTIKNQLVNIKSGRSLYILPDIASNPSHLIDEYESYFEDLGATDESQIVNNSEEERAEVEAEETKGIELAAPNELKTEIERADSLIKWGYRDLAKWHLYEVEKNLKKKSSAEPLIEYYGNKEYYNRALSLMNVIASPAGKYLNKKDDSLLWGSLFPKAYQGLVEKESKRKKVHPYMVWSIMKAETQYKDDAISPVGAIGLMQFMPYTSNKVAIMLNEPHDPQALFNPEYAVRYGTTYLKKLYDELGGQMPLVAAAYNGGPHRVKLWLKNLKERDNSNIEYDVFVEHIPFNETRTYVKRVVNYNLIYQKLYDEKLDFKSTKWMLDKIPFSPTEPLVLKEEWPFDKKN